MHWAFFSWHIIKLPVFPSKSVSPEEINELNIVFPNILKNIIEFNENYFGDICDFDTFGFINIASLLWGTSDIKF